MDVARNGCEILCRALATMCPASRRRTHDLIFLAFSLCVYILHASDQRREAVKAMECYLLNLPPNYVPTCYKHLPSLGSVVTYTGLR